MLLKDKSLSFSASEEPCNLYNSSIEYRNERLLTIGSEKTEYQLKLIAAEIRLRNMIIQQEIYFIGEMLVQAKEMLKGTKKTFKTWIKENFDFGYHTAVNFSNVYTACLGQLELIQHVKPSVLYRISSKEFSKELRDYLIFNNLLAHLRIKELKEIYTEYREKGFNSVKLKLEEKAKIPLAKQYLVPYLDNLFKIITYLEKQRSALEHKLHNFEDITLRKGPPEKGDKIFSIISESLKQCLAILNQAKTLSNQKILELDNMVYRGFNEAHSLQCYKRFIVLDVNAEEGKNMHIPNLTGNPFRSRLRIQDGTVDFERQFSMTSFAEFYETPPEDKENAGRLPDNECLGKVPPTNK